MSSSQAETVEHLQSSGEPQAVRQINDSHRAGSNTEGLWAGAGLGFTLLSCYTNTVTVTESLLFIVSNNLSSPNVLSCNLQWICLYEVYANAISGNYIVAHFHTTPHVVSVKMRKRHVAE